MTDRACPHGDPYCPCQDGDACHYRDYVLVDGSVSPAVPCPRTGLAPCDLCVRDEA